MFEHRFRDAPFQRPSLNPHPGLRSQLFPIAKSRTNPRPLLPFLIRKRREAALIEHVRERWKRPPRVPESIERPTAASDRATATKSAALMSARRSLFGLWGLARVSLLQLPTVPS